MKYVWAVTGDSESGDHYGPFVFAAEPSDQQLRKLVREECDWPEEDDDGPGVYGSYTYITVSKVAVR